MVQVGDYVLMRKEEKSPLGQLMLAEHPLLKRKVALKKLAFPLDAKFWEELQEKVASLASLSHPHIARLQNVFVQEGECYFAYDWLSSSQNPCRNLQEFVEEEKPSEEQIHYLMMQIASAIDYMHAEGVLHLNIKASNVLIDTSQERPTAYIADAGLASLFPPKTLLTVLLEECCKSMGSSRELSSFWESFYALAPEQKEGKPLVASDRYAFGVLLYKLLMGEYPQGRFPLPSEERSFTYFWDDLLISCLTPHPDSRPKYLWQVMERVREGQSEGLSLRPKLGPGEINRPQFESDPSAVFHVESAIVRYQPQAQEEKQLQPIDTKMIVIPGGVFCRGSQQGGRDESPSHKVQLAAYAMDVHPVTNEQFVRFLEVMGGEKDGNNHDMIRLKESRIKKSSGHFLIEAGYHKHPVVGVSWYGAVAYAKWVGKRLPTEAEWEVAACGGLESPTYPTGEEISKNQANFFSSDTTPVTSYPPNGYGLYDMAGNVYEWCSDWYDYHYYEVSVQEPNQPTGPAQGVYRVLRGGGWKSLKEDMRCSYRHRNNPGTMNATYGFRCATDVAF
ncbi:MAG: serine/threonine protein kinase [Chlamydiae bacterium]|nr:serine/threonine protein kinase [Chlamydiota bacterium]